MGLPAAVLDVERSVSSSKLEIYLNDAAYLLLDPKRDYLLVIVYGDNVSDVNFVSERLETKLLEAVKAQGPLSCRYYRESVIPKEVELYVSDVKPEDSYTSLFEQVISFRRGGQANALLLVRDSNGILRNYVGISEVYILDAKWLLN